MLNAIISFIWAQVKGHFWSAMEYTFKRILGYGKDEKFQNEDIFFDWFPLMEIYHSVELPRFRQIYLWFRQQPITLFILLETSHRHDLVASSQFAHQSILISNLGVNLWGIFMDGRYLIGPMVLDDLMRAWLQRHLTLISNWFEIIRTNTCYWTFIN